MGVLGRARLGVPARESGSLQLDSSLVIGLLVLIAAGTLFAFGTSIACLFDKEASQVDRAGFYSSAPVVVTGTTATGGSVTWDTQGSDGPYTVLRARPGTAGLDMGDTGTWESLATTDSPPASGLDIRAGDSVVVVSDMGRCGYRLSGVTWAGTDPPAVPVSGFGVLSGVNTPTGFSMTFNDQDGVAPFSVYRSASSVVDTAVLEPLAVVDGGAFVDTAVRSNYTYMVYDSTGQDTNRVMAATGFTGPMYSEAGEMDFYVTAGSAPVRRYAGTLGTSAAALRATLAAVTPDASGGIWTDKDGSIYTMTAPYTPLTTEYFAVDARFEGAPFLNQPINPASPSLGIWGGFIGGSTQSSFRRYSPSGDLMNAMAQNRGRWGTPPDPSGVYSPPDLYANLATPEPRANTAVHFLGDKLVADVGWWSVVMNKDGSGDVPRGYGEDAAYRGNMTGPRAHTPYGLVFEYNLGNLLFSKSVASGRAGQLSFLTTSTAGDPGGVPTAPSGNNSVDFVVADSLQRIYATRRAPGPVNKVFAFEWDGSKYVRVGSLTTSALVVLAVSDTDLLYALNKATRVVTIYDFGTSGFTPIATVTGLPVGVTSVAPLRTTDLSW